MWPDGIKVFGLTWLKLLPAFVSHKTCWMIEGFGFYTIYLYLVISLMGIAVQYFINILKIWEHP